MHSDTYATEQNGNPYQKKKKLWSLKVKSSSITIALTSAHLPSLSSCTCAHQSSLSSFDAESQN